MTDNPRSPLKSRALNNPGESSERRRRDLVLDRLLHPLLVALFLVLMAITEVVRDVTKAPPMPWLWGFVAIVAIAWAAARVKGALPELRQLGQGIEGEKAVGQYLEKLRSDGYVVFHDLQGAGFNVDHVVIGPTGAYTIETKAWSKPRKGEPRILFDGRVLTATGFEPDRDPVVQARSQASWLRELLHESTGKTIPVRPVVLFPGWYIEQAEGATREVWVLNPKAFPEFLKQATPRLDPDDIRIAAFHISRYGRTDGTRATSLNAI